MSYLWTVEKQDALKSLLTGLLSAAAGAVLLYLNNLVSAGNFNLADVDWGMVLQIAQGAIIGDLVRRFGTDHSGKFLGKIG
jgi:hypothetical protein